MPEFQMIDTGAVRIHAAVEGEGGARTDALAHHHAVRLHAAGGQGLVRREGAAAHHKGPNLLLIGAGVVVVGGCLLLL